MVKVFELTTNARDGYAKWMVRGITDYDQAKIIALKGFGKKNFSGMVSYYDDYPSKYGTDWSKKALTINQFLSQTKKFYKDR